MGVVHIRFKESMNACEGSKISFKRSLVAVLLDDLCSIHYDFVEMMQNNIREERYETNSYR